MIDRLPGILVTVAACFGVAVAATWLHGVLNPPPPAGWVCFDVVRRTATDTQRSSRCGPLDGWHTEDLPDGTRVAVPDRPAVDRRRLVNE